MKYLVRDRLFGFGDDFWVDDEEGRHAFFVDGKVMRVRDTLEIKDPGGRVVAEVKKKLVSMRPAMTVERDGEQLATVRKKRLTLLRERYRAELATGEELEITGNILDKEYDIEYDGERLARISRKWFRLRDTYAVDVERPDADPALILAVAVCVDRLAEREQAGEGGGD